MSQQNVELLRGVLESAPTGPEALFAILDEDVVWDVRAFPDGAVFHGPDGVAEFFQSWAGAFDDFGFEAEDFIDAGDAVVVPLRQWGRGKETGVEVEGRTWQVFTIRDGKIISCVGHATKESAFEAAGITG